MVDKLFEDLRAGSELETITQRDIEQPGSPERVAGELAVKCLLDEAEVLFEADNLDVPAHWRNILEDAPVEDFDCDMCTTEA